LFSFKEGDFLKEARIPEREEEETTSAWGWQLFLLHSQKIVCKGLVRTFQISLAPCEGYPKLFFLRESAEERGEIFQTLHLLNFLNSLKSPASSFLWKKKKKKKSN